MNRRNFVKNILSLGIIAASPKIFSESYLGKINPYIPEDYVRTLSKMTKINGEWQYIVFSFSEATSKKKLYINGVDMTDSIPF